MVTPDIPHDVEEIAATSRPDLLLICDHASNHVPGDFMPDLGLPAADFMRHIAYDIGAHGVTHALAGLMGAGAVLSCFSRLLIDPNRGDDDPTLVPLLGDGSIIPANRGISEAEITRRRARFSAPYHDRISSRLAAIGPDAIVISIHSFTRQMQGGPIRPWEIGVLSAEDRRIADPLITAYKALGVCTGDNEPYSGRLPGDTLSRHGIDTGLRHVLIELRNDLIETEAGQAQWARTLAGPLLELLPAPPT